MALRRSDWISEEHDKDQEKQTSYRPVSASHVKSDRARVPTTSAQRPHSATAANARPVSGGADRLNQPTVPPETPHSRPTTARAQGAGNEASCLPRLDRTGKEICFNSVGVQASPVSHTRFYFPDSLTSPRTSAFYQHFDVLVPSAEALDDKRSFVLDETLPGPIIKQWARLYYVQCAEHPERGSSVSFPQMSLEKSKDVLHNENSPAWSASAAKDGSAESDGTSGEGQQQHEHMRLVDFCRLVCRLQPRTPYDTEALSLLRAGLLEHTSNSLLNATADLERQHKKREQALSEEYARKLERVQNELNQHIEALSSQLKSEQASLASTQKTAMAQRFARNVQKQLAEEKQSRANERERQNLSKDEQIANAQSTIADLRSELANAKQLAAEREESMQEQITQEQQHASELQSQLEGSRHQIEVAQQEKAELNHKLNELQSAYELREEELQSQMSRLRNAFEKRLEEANAQVRRQAAKLEEKTKDMSERTSLETKLQQRDQEIQRLQGIEDRLETVEGDRADLESQLNELKWRMRAFTSNEGGDQSETIASLYEEIAQLKSQESGKERLAESNANLRARLNAISKERDDAVAEIEQVRIRLNELEGEEGMLEHLRQERDDAESRLKEALDAATQMHRDKATTHASGSVSESEDITVGSRETVTLEKKPDSLHDETKRLKSGEPGRPEEQAAPGTTNNECPRKVETDEAQPMEAGESYTAAMLSQSQVEKLNEAFKRFRTELLEYSNSCSSSLGDDEHLFAETNQFLEELQNRNALQANEGGATGENYVHATEAQLAKVRESVKCMQDQVARLQQEDPSSTPRNLQHLVSEMQINLHAKPSVKKASRADSASSDTAVSSWRSSTNEAAAGNLDTGQQGIVQDTGGYANADTPSEAPSHALAEDSRALSQRHKPYVEAGSSDSNRTDRCVQTSTDVVCSKCSEHLHPPSVRHAAKDEDRAVPNQRAAANSQATSTSRPNSTNSRHSSARGQAASATFSETSFLYDAEAHKALEEKGQVRPYLKKLFGRRGEWRSAQTIDDVVYQASAAISYINTGEKRSAAPVMIAEVAYDLNEDVDERSEDVHPGVFFRRTTSYPNEEAFEPIVSEKEGSAFVDPNSESAKLLYDVSEQRKEVSKTLSNGVKLHAYPIVLDNGELWGVYIAQGEAASKEEQQERQYISSGLGRTASKVRHEVGEAGEQMHRRIENVNNTLTFGREPSKRPTQSAQAMDAEGEKHKLQEDLYDLREQISDADITKDDVVRHLRSQSQTNHAGSLSEIKRYRRPSELRDVLGALLATLLLVDEQASDEIKDSLSDDGKLPLHPNALVHLWNNVRRLFKPQKVVSQMEAFDVAQTFRQLARDDTADADFQQRLALAEGVLSDMSKEKARRTSSSAAFLMEWSILVCRLKHAYAEEVEYEKQIEDIDQKFADTIAG